MILVLVDLTNLIAFLFHQSVFRVVSFQSIGSLSLLSTVSTAFGTPCTGKGKDLWGAASVPI